MEDKKENKKRFVINEALFITTAYLFLVILGFSKLFSARDLAEAAVSFILLIIFTPLFLLELRNFLNKKP